jgi:cytochrome c556
MRTGRGRFAAAGLLFLSAVASQQCTSKAAAPAAVPSDVAPIVSIKELMENIIDPIADNIFDAVGTDATVKGIVETKPTTDDDWAKVRIGAVTLAEGTNLLKMPRRVAPPGDKNNSNGPNAPELSPEQIQAKIDGNRALWNSHADELRDAALKVMDIVKAKDTDALFQAGSAIDKVCENCHLEYWYPGDRKAVEEDETQRATFTKPAMKK